MRKAGGVKVRSWKGTEGVEHRCCHSAFGGGCRVDGGDRWMSAHMGPPQLRVLYLSVVLRLNCLLWGNASPLTALENDNYLAGSKE